MRAASSGGQSAPLIRVRSVVRVHCGPYKKDSDICYYPFYFVVVGGRTTFWFEREVAEGEVLLRLCDQHISKTRRPVKRHRARQSTAAHIKKDSFKGVFFNICLQCRFQSKSFILQGRPLSIQYVVMSTLPSKMINNHFARGLIRVVLDLAFLMQIFIKILLCNIYGLTCFV